MNQEHMIVAGDLKNRLLRVVPMVNFRLMASPAKKEDGDTSDMDVFILVDKLDQDIQNRVSDTVWDVGADHNISITYWIAPKEDAETPEVKKILEEGIRVK